MADEIDEDERKRLVSVWNERAKLTATFCNQVAAALFAVGAVAPYIGTFLADKPAALPVVATSVLICTALAIGIHLWGRYILGGLRT